MDDDAKVEMQLLESKVIAVVGLSPDPERPSHYVSKYLQEAGYRIIPVNPNLTSVLGETCYPDLKSIPIKVDMVDVFRRPEYTPDIVNDAVEIGVKFVWLQDKVINNEAESIAESNGIPIVMDN
ncbi:MAG: CoA-binding protein [Chloroflexi bacterium]|nr:CoA-binding protein [Chloroflexota bacterium]